MMNRKQMEEILQKYSTPLYVFDIGVLKQRIAYLRKCCRDMYPCAMP